MSRSRRSAIDGGFEFSGSAWTRTSGQDSSLLGDPLSLQPIALAALPANFGGLEAVTQLVFWRVGLLSLGTPTQAQINFINDYSQGNPLNGRDVWSVFDNFFLVGFSPSSYQGEAEYAYGLVDFEPSFNISEAEEVTFFGFGSLQNSDAQLILTRNDFTLFQKIGDNRLYGYQLGGQRHIMANDIVQETFSSVELFRFSGTSGADVLDAPAGVSATLLGLGGNDVLRGGAAGDRLTGGTGADTLTGGAGSDYYTYLTVSDSSVASGIDLITDFRRGADRIDATAITGATVYSNLLVNGVHELSFVTGSGTLLIRSTEPISNNDIYINLALTGTAGVDELTGLSGDDIILGLGGNDTLFGRIGNDRLEGGAGADTLTGGSGNNVFVYRAVSDSSVAANSVDLITDFIFPKDRIEALGLGVTAYAITLVNGVTQLTLTAPSGQLLIRSTNELRPADIRIGAPLSITGTAAAETLQGLDGDDLIIGGGGQDQIFGNDGNDTIRGSSVGSSLFGGNGNDLIEGGAGLDYLDGEDGNDTLFGSDERDQLFGFTGDDRLDGGTGADSLYGGGGADALLGGAGADYLEGGSGADTIEGGSGSDTLTGSTDVYNDEFGNPITGDRAVDIFLFRSVAESNLDNGTDVINDFETGIDIIDARNLQVSSYLLEFNQVTLRTPVGDLVISLFGSEVRPGDIRIGNGLILTGTDAGNVLEGLDGNDSISGGGGDDLLLGNLGNDTLRGGLGKDRLTFQGGDDLIDGGVESDTVDAWTTKVGVTIDLQLGRLFSSIGNATLVSIENARGGAGNDTLIARDRAAPEIAKAQASVIATPATALSLNGRFGLDANPDIGNATSVPHATVLATASGQTEIYAVTAASGSTLTVDIDGTSGFDSFVEIYNSGGTRIAFNDDTNVDPGSITARDSFVVQPIAAAGTYYIHVLRFATTTTGTPITAGQTYVMHVSLTGAAMASTGSELQGGDGDDLLISGRGDDTLIGNASGPAGDTASFENAGTAVTANLKTGIASGDGNDTLNGIRNLNGSVFNDTLIGRDFGTRLFGDDGNDTLVGGNGVDSLFGDDGNDVLHFGAFFTSADRADGGAGTGDRVELLGDYAAGVTLSATSAIGVEIFSLLPGSDTRFGAPGNLNFSYRIITGNAAIAAGQSLTFLGGALRSTERFTLDASSELDGFVTATGGQGNDDLTGGSLGDILSASGGADRVSGGAGDDRLTGGAGNDTLDGGSGIDTATFTGSRRDYSVTRNGDTVTIRDLRASADGTDTLTGIERVQFTDGLMGLIPEELVLFLPGTRDLITWDSTQGSNGFTYFFRLGANSTVAATADFTGDGRTDVLLSQPGGGLIRWDPTLGGNGFAVLPAAPGFEVIGRGDLVGNSATDLLLKNAAGQLRILDPVAGSISDLFSLASGWSVAGVGNINGTGKADVVLQNSVSRAVIAFTDQGWRDLITLGSGWEIAGLGDVTGGLADDFILQRNDGVTIFWDSTQGGNGFRDFATIGPAWNFAGFNDLNGDGRDDVVLQNDNGLAIYWTGSNWVDLGSTLIGTELVGTGVFP
jgi:Ca2+-binding RTX toxin-like protein